MASSLTERLDALEKRADKAEKKAREQHGRIVALQTALKPAEETEDK